MTRPATAGCGCGGGAKSLQGGKKGVCGCDCGGSSCSRCEGAELGYKRPRFFSGQLLTEDDLQSLIDYVVGKSRLHNRMLFGEGIACGLKVSKDVCDPRKIVVSSGYALDCCGNDIVVPCSVTLDVMQLIRELRMRMLGKDCGDPCEKGSTAGIPAAEAPAAEAMGDGPIALAATKAVKPTTTYCLYVRYCEEQSDPVAPYDGEEACGAGDCVDTRVREGFVFELRCVPEELLARDAKRNSALVSRIQHLERVAKLAAEADHEPTAGKRDAVLSYTVSMLSREPFDAQPALLRNLAEAGNLAPGQETRAAFGSLVGRAILRLLQHWDCDALLPDCLPCDDEAVLVSCLKVMECEVTEVCDAVRQPIFSAAFIHQLRLTDQWRALVMHLCCADQRKTTVKPAIGQMLAGGRTQREVVAARASRMEAASAELAATGAAAATSAAAAAQAPEALTPEVSLVLAVAQERAERLRATDDPDARLTLVPQMMHTYAVANGIVAEAPTAHEHADLEDKIASLTKELTQIKQVLGHLFEKSPVTEAAPPEEIAKSAGGRRSGRKGSAK